MLTLKFIQKHLATSVFVLVVGAILLFENVSIRPPFYPEYMALKGVLIEQLAVAPALLKLLDSAFLQFLPDSSGTLYVGYLALGLAICIFIFFVERGSSTSVSLSSSGGTRTPPRSFRSFLFPNGFFDNPNIRIDLLLFATKLFWTGFALYIPFLAPQAVASFVGTSLDTQFGSPGFEATPLVCILFSILLLLVTDLAFYATHWFQHFTRFGWSLHETHHSQRELNIFTDDRENPLNLILITLFPSGVFAVSLGLFLFYFPESRVIMFANVSLGYLLWLPTKIFRHSHILIRYPRWIEWLIQSPAFHVVHHSYLPEHQNKNLGNYTTIWDRLFGTLYVPKPGETYQFGTGEEEVEKKHQTLSGIYIWQSVRIVRQFFASARGILLKLKLS